MTTEERDADRKAEASLRAAVDSESSARDAHSPLSLFPLPFTRPFDSPWLDTCSAESLHQLPRNIDLTAQVSLFSRARSSLRLRPELTSHPRHSEAPLPRLCTCYLAVSARTAALYPGITPPEERGRWLVLADSLESSSRPLPFPSAPTRAHTALSQT